MKIKLFIVVVLLICTNQLQAQDVIMSLDTFTSYAADQDSSIPDDVTYIKDVNHMLDPFLGTFTGTYDGKIITFQITKYTDSSHGVALDALNIKYKVESNNGVILAQTLNIPNNSHDISGRRFNLSGLYMATYVGFDGCGQAGTFYLNLRDTTNQFTLTPNQLIVYMDQSRGLLNNEDCPDGASPHVFPTNEQFTLNRL